MTIRKMGFVCFFVFSCHVSAGYVYEFNKDVNVEFGARIVLQYEDFEITPEDGPLIDDQEFIVRRLRPSVTAKFGKDWQAKLAWGVGKGRNSVSDAYIRYRGIEWLDIKLGNETLPFSRERMTSSARQHSPERTLVGDDEFGIPGRQPGLHLETDFDGPLTLYLAYAQADIHGDLLTEIQFVNPIGNRGIPNRLLDEGTITVGRIDFDIWRGARYRQGHLRGKPGITLSLAAYDWQNNDIATELDSAEGYEATVAYRGHDVSVDVEYNNISARTPFDIDRPLFSNGKADIQQFSVEGGYMVWKKDLEVFASYQTMQSDNWEHDWEVREVGINYFFSGHNHKLQMSYRDHDNVKGKLTEEESLFLQWQYNY